MYNKILIEASAIESYGDLLEYILNRYYVATNNDLEVDEECLRLPNKFYSRVWIPSRSRRNLDFSFNTIVDTPDGRDKLFSSVEKLIVLTIVPEDLLFVTAFTLNHMFAGANDKTYYGIDVNLLHIDTFNKLNINVPAIKEMLNSLITSYHLTCNKENPHVDRYILREFFKFGFKNPKNHRALLTQDNIFDKSIDKTVYRLPITSMHIYKIFLDELTSISNFFNIGLAIDFKELEQLHRLFVKNIQFIDIRQPCDNVINAVINKQSVSIPKLKLLQESYINAQLENQFNKEMPFMMTDYFTNTKQIIEHLEIK